MIITSPHYNRPDCSRQMIESLRSAIGIEDWNVLFICEPTCDEVIKLCQNSNLPKYDVIINNKLLGLWTTKKKCLEIGFQRSNFLIHLEDDLLFAKDILLFYEWAAKSYEGAKEVFTANAFNRIRAFDFYNRKCPNCGMPFYGEVRLRQKFTSIGFATWKNRYARFIEEWDGSDVFLEYYRKANNFVEAYPMLSRLNHIGFTQGVCFDDDLVRDIMKAGNAPTGLYAHQEDEGPIRWQTSRPKIATNQDGLEWVKLSDSYCRTRSTSSYYKEKHFLDFWAGNMCYEIQNFFAT